MSIETAIVALLKSSTAITDLVSDRIYADRAPDTSPRPLIIYQVISYVPMNQLTGDTGKARTRMQFTLLADTKAASVSLGEALRKTLQRYRGTSDGTEIHDIMLDSMFDHPYDLDTRQTARSADYMIIHEETA